MNSEGKSSALVRKKSKTEPTQGVEDEEEVHHYPLPPQTTKIKNVPKVLTSKNINNNNNTSNSSNSKCTTTTTSTTSSEIETDVCYNVPYQCDIYSLPIDSIVSPDGNTNGSTSTKSRNYRKINDNTSSTVSVTPSSRKSHYLNNHVRNNSSHQSNDINLGQHENKTILQEEENDHQQEQLPTRVMSRKELNLRLQGTTTTPPASANHNTNNSSSSNGESQQQSYQKSNAYNNSENDDGGSSDSGGGKKKKKKNLGLRLNEKNNNENVQTTTAVNDNDSKIRWSKKRRSRSVENDNQRKLIQSSAAQPSQITTTKFNSSKNGGKRNFGHTIMNLFRRNRSQLKTVQLPHNNNDLKMNNEILLPVSRALPPPPLPPTPVEEEEIEHQLDSESPLEPRDFAASIEKVKDQGWYFGPLASDEAEDLLRGEPNGSFIVRDSSDDRYIFSLTFKLNGLVRHVRIEHDQGNFSFGPLTRFKAATIVDFVEKAVAHSRSGRYLFFLHRRPVLGPMQLQLLHPFSRFRKIRSLQHMCRFVILKHVRRDLLNTLPLPPPLLEYLNTPHYYFEQQELSSKSNNTS